MRDKKFIVVVQDEFTLRFDLHGTDLNMLDLYLVFSE